MSSLIGKILQVGLFGESHGNGIGVVVYGLPFGFEVSKRQLDKFLERRAPGKSRFTTKRRETDNYEIISGYYNGRTTGTPFAAIIRNHDEYSKDYENIKTLVRPSHADYTGELRYGGFEDNRGGGHFSGRITAPLCIAGGIALQILKNYGIEIYAHISSLYNLKDIPIDRVEIEKQRIVGEKSLAFFDDERMEEAKSLLDKIIEDGDSVGGTVEVMVHGVQPGIGNPMFEGVESKLSSIIFGIPGVKGVEFGSGFECGSMKGSQHNDPFVMVDGKVVTKTNHSAGINGGITNGMPIVLKVAVKPTPSISLEQDTIDIKEKSNKKLKIQGRHDPAIIVRAVPVIEAAVALGILDLVLEAKSYGHK